MAGIFTRRAILQILNTDDLTPEERAEQLFSLYGRAIDDGYVTKSAAEAAKNEAVEAAKAAAPAPEPVNVKESEDYLALQAEYNAFKAKESARRSSDFKDVKDKFFDAVYAQIDRSEGATPIAEQLNTLRTEYEEYFAPSNPQPEPKKTPVFSQPPAHSSQPQTEADKIRADFMQGLSLPANVKKKG